MKELPQITPRQAAALVNSGDRILVGGFGMTGNPTQILHALAETDVREVTYIANNVGEPGLGGGRMLRNGQISKAIGSFFTSNPEAVAAAQNGAIEFEVMPQGTMVEAIRAGGAGLGGFYTPTAAGTVLAEGRETKLIGGREQVFQPALRADVALVRAWSADTTGNLVYRMTEQNFNRAMATAADLVIAEVEERVPAGALPPESIHTPGCFVDYLVPVRTSAADLGTSAAIEGSGKRAGEVRMQLARRALAELKPGDIVNLGVGIPTLVADLITPAHGIVLHTENGMLGVGPSPERGGAMEYPVNASKIPVTALTGSSYFDSADSFCDDSGRARGRGGYGRPAGGRGGQPGELGCAGAAAAGGWRRDGPGVGREAVDRDDDTREPRPAVEDRSALHATADGDGRGGCGDHGAGGVPVCRGAADADRADAGDDAG